MFSNIADGISIGNPAFARNSSYIIAFDYIEEDNYSLLAANVETGEVALMFENTGLSYPSYTAEDDQVYITSEGFFGTDVFKLDLESSKITAVSGSEALLIEDARWAVPFRNGTRVLSDVEEIDINADQLNVFPNPATDLISFEVEMDGHEKAVLEIRSINGQLMLSERLELYSGVNRKSVDISQVPSGSYTVTLKNDHFQKVSVISKN
jgi:hypothetical protein